LGQVKLRHIETFQKPIFTIGRDVDLMQATSDRTNGSRIATAEMFKMEANELRVLFLEITHERMFRCERTATCPRVWSDGVTNLSWN
jgi:hypothetical protein